MKAKVLSLSTTLTTTKLLSLSRRTLSTTWHPWVNLFDVCVRVVCAVARDFRQNIIQSLQLKKSCCCRRHFPPILCNDKKFPLCANLTLIWRRRVCQPQQRRRRRRRLALLLLHECVRENLMTRKWGFSCKSKLKENNLKKICERKRRSSSYSFSNSWHIRIFCSCLCPWRTAQKMGDWKASLLTFFLSLSLKKKN